MNDNDTAAEQESITGSMFLYSQPELLTKEQHGHLGITRPPRPFDFVKSERAIPIALAEMASAQRNYPIVFSDTKQPLLLAAVGVLDENNLFVGDDGLWDDSAYVPAYLRCYPFALAMRPDGQASVIIDRAAPHISEDPEYPFFEGDNLSTAVQEHVNFCSQHNAYTQATREFCRRMVELDMLTGQQVTYKGETASQEKPIASYVAVNMQKLDELDADGPHKMYKDVILSAVYAHNFSLDNWMRLLERRKSLGLELWPEPQT